MTTTRLIVTIFVASVCTVAAMFLLFSAPKTTSFQSKEVTPAVYDAYVHWAQRFGKRYTTEEKNHRILIFAENLNEIASHNSNTHNLYSLGLNQFSDLTNEEFQSLYLDPLEEDSKVSAPLRYLDISNVADSVDWREKGSVSDIRDQGSCGSCWAFGSVSALEGLHHIKTGSLELLSEQQLVDCSGSYGNMGCSGGLRDAAFKYIIDFGIERRADYPYTARDDKCKYNESKTISFQITGYVSVPLDQAQLVAAINQQPVSVGVCASTWQSYSKGILTNCCTSINHGVGAIGYGSENGTDYFLVKNSWGNGWGEKGFIRVLRTASGTGTCNIAGRAYYPTI